MLWPATNHTEFKLYAFSFNTHHAPETAARIAAAASSSVTLLRIVVVELGGWRWLVLKGVNDSNRVRPYLSFKLASSIPQVHVLAV